MDDKLKIGRNGRLDRELWVWKDSGTAKRCTKVDFLEGSKCFFLVFRVISMS